MEECYLVEKYLLIFVCHIEKYSCFFLIQMKKKSLRLEPLISQKEKYSKYILISQNKN